MPCSLGDQVAALDWYHTLDLAPGVVTPGWFDTRRVAGRLPFPRVDGARCLDVGTFDGFWAFEMERRGAAEVVAVDVLDPAAWDWPAGSEVRALHEIGRRKGQGEGFVLARDTLGSRVDRREVSVYDLDPAAVGTFDLVYAGSLLLHLRDPVGALGRIRNVVRPTGHLLVVDSVDPFLTLTARRPVAALDGLGRPWWWKPNPAGVARMLVAAGFRPLGRPQLVWMPPGAGQPRPRPTASLVRYRGGREALLRAWVGDPHAAVLARPR